MEKGRFGVVQGAVERETSSKPVDGLLHDRLGVVGQTEPGRALDRFTGADAHAGARLDQDKGLEQSAGEVAIEEVVGATEELVKRRLGSDDLPDLVVLRDAGVPLLGGEDRRPKGPAVVVEDGGEVVAADAVAVLLSPAGLGAQ